ncbi:MAG: hypothetical protein GY714_15815 [Desulfobacterales bacterium]|nr:hypothetical protein [Desulfobacterales bacterium]
MNKLKIGNRLVGPGEPVFIIAEAGINHDGDILRAHEMIDAAAKVGADCVKFHTHLAYDEMVNVNTPASESQFNLVKKMEFTIDDHLELKEHASLKGLIFMSTPFSKEAVDILDEVNVDAYKVGSGELANLPLLGYMAEKLNKPFIVSTGMSSFSEVEATVEFLKKRNTEFGIMQCTSRYPTPPSDVHLGVISRYIDDFGIPVGFSDHSPVNYTVFAAIPLGVCMIEKHFTISREWPGPDQQSSLEPHEFADLVKGIRDIETALSDKKTVHNEEKDLQIIFRASVVATKNIPENTNITDDMIWVKRPGCGIPANQMNSVIGKKSNREIKKNELISWEDFN